MNPRPSGPKPDALPSYATLRHHGIIITESAAGAMTILRECCQAYTSGTYLRLRLSGRSPTIIMPSSDHGEPIPESAWRPASPVHIRMLKSGARIPRQVRSFRLSRRDHARRKALRKGSGVMPPAVPKRWDTWPFSGAVFPVKTSTSLSEFNRLVVQ